MKLGIGTYTFGWAMGVPGYPPPPIPMTHERLLKKAAQLGVRVVQLADDVQMPDRSDAELAAIRGLASELRLELELGTRGIDADHLRDYAALAVKLSAPLVRVIIEGTPHPTPEEVVAVFRQVLPDYDRANVRLAIENHDRFPAAMLAQMIERIASPRVGICLDTANSLGCAEGVETLLRVLGQWVINLHVKDVQIKRPSHRRGFLVEGCPIGHGQVDIPWVLDELRARGREVNAILEQWPSPEATMAESIAKEDAWATESIRYLRQFIPE
jgi:sugar phosphate isomerase/epimerase